MSVCETKHLRLCRSLEMAYRLHLSRTLVCLFTSVVCVCKHLPSLIIFMITGANSTFPVLDRVGVSNTGIFIQLGWVLSLSRVVVDYVDNIMLQVCRLM